LKPVWLSGDEAAWTRQAEGALQLLVGTPGAGEPIRTWSGPYRAILEPSPDGQKLLVSAARRSVARRALEREHWVYDRATEDWTELTTTIEQAAGDPWVRVAWAGPDSLAVAGGGVLAFHDLQEPSGLRYVVGGP
jgi:hypothetical protein